MSDTRKLVLRMRMDNRDEEYDEQFDPTTLTDPRDVGRRRYKHDPRTVATLEEGEAWGRELLAAFNRTCKPGESSRSFVSVRWSDA